MYLYETHCHSSDCSRCSRSTAREMVRAYYNAGFAGMVLTDHFVTGCTAVDLCKPWEEQMLQYKNAYLEAVDEAAGLDFDVIFGLEHVYEGGKEVLIYGVEPDFLLENPDLVQIPLENLVERVHAVGGVVVHAHPYRIRDYIDPEVLPRLDLVDGIEVYNAGNRPEDDNKAALASGLQGNYILTSGSDLHKADSPRLGQAGIFFSHRVRSSAQLAAALKDSICGYLVNGQAVSQIREEHLPY